jgi:S1-C subfamily serine protease
VDTVNRVVPQLIETGTYVRPALGVVVDERLNQLVTRRLNVRGVAILRVTPGSAADKAGLRGVRTEGDGALVPGDIILEVDETAVESVPRLLNRLDEHKVGDTVHLTLWRDGQRTEARVTLQGGGQ